MAHILLFNIARGRDHISDSSWTARVPPRTIAPETQRPDLSVGPCDIPGNFLRSHTLARAVPSGLRGLTSVFGMGTGGSPSLRSPRVGAGKLTACKLGRIEYLTGLARSEYVCIHNKFYGQAERAISNGQLSMLPHLHIRPIKQVVFLCSCYLSVGRSHLGEGFTLICIQRLS